MKTTPPNASESIQIAVTIALDEPAVDLLAKRIARAVMELAQQSGQFQQQRTSTQTDSDVPQMLSRAQAAVYLNVKPQTLSMWACTGRHSLPFIRCGRLTRYRRSDLDAWIQGRRGTSSAEIKAAETQTPGRRNQSRSGRS